MPGLKEGLRDVLILPPLISRPLDYMQLVSSPDKFRPQLNYPKPDSIHSTCSTSFFLLFTIRHNTFYAQMRHAIYPRRVDLCDGE